MYAANSSTGVILKITPGGVASTFASGLSAPDFMSFDSHENLYVADIGNENVIKITPGGVESTVASGLSLADGTAVDSAGNLFVSEGIGNILKFTGGVQSTFATGLGAAQGMEFDASGNLIVADSTGEVYKFTPGGARTTLASGLESPLDVVVVPEPSVMSLLAVGTVAFVVRRHRKV